MIWIVLIFRVAGLIVLGAMILFGFITIVGALLVPVDLPQSFYRVVQPLRGYRERRMRSKPQRRARRGE